MVKCFDKSCTWTVIFGLYIFSLLLSFVPSSAVLFNVIGFFRLYFPCLLLSLHIRRFLPRLFICFGWFSFELCSFLQSFPRTVFFPPHQVSCVFFSLIVCLVPSSSVALSFFQSLSFRFTLISYGLHVSFISHHRWLVNIWFGNGCFGSGIRQRNVLAV